MILGNTHDETRAFIGLDLPRVQGLGWDNIARTHRAGAAHRRAARMGRIPISRPLPDWSPTEIFYAATTAGRSWRGQVIEAEARAQAGAPGWVYQVDFTSRTDPRRAPSTRMDTSPTVFGTLGAPGPRRARARMPGSLRSDAGKLCRLRCYGRSQPPGPAGMAPLRPAIARDDDPRRALAHRERSAPVAVRNCVLRRRIPCISRPAADPSRLQFAVSRILTCPYRFRYFVMTPVT